MNQTTTAPSPPPQEHEEEVITMHDIAHELLAMADRVAIGDGDPLELATDIHILDKAIKAIKDGLRDKVLETLKARGQKSVEAYGFIITQKAGAATAIYKDVPYVEAAEEWLKKAKEVAKLHYEEAKQSQVPVVIHHPDFGEVSVGAKVEKGKPTYSIKEMKK